MSLDESELYDKNSYCASMMDSDAVNSLNHTTACKTGAKSSCAPKFCSWSFLLTIKANFASSVDERKRLKVHISDNLNAQ